MQHDHKRNLKARFEQYQASKTVLFWACAGSVVVATIAGFTWGGWVTGGTAQEMAHDAGAQGRHEVAAVVCVDRFMAAPDAGVQLAALKEISSSYQRDKFVQSGGWATIVPDSSGDDREAAGLCSEELVKLESPVSGEVQASTDAAVVRQ